VILKIFSFKKTKFKKEYDVCDSTTKTMSKYMEGCIFMDVTLKKYLDFLNMEPSPS